MTPSSLNYSKESHEAWYDRVSHSGELQPHVPTTETERLMEWGDNSHSETEWHLVDIVESCVDQVPEPHRTLLKLRFSDQYSYNKITEIMGYSSKSHAWYHVQKALGMLKEILLIDPTIRRRYED